MTNLGRNFSPLIAVAQMALTCGQMAIPSGNGCIQLVDSAVYRP